MTHSAQDTAQGIRRVTWRSIWVNLFLSLLQIAVGWIGHSQALLADGFHSLSDLVSDAVVLLAARGATQAADEDHPYGHGRFENAAALLLGVLMLAVGLGMVWAAAQRLQAPGAMQRVSSLALVVALATLVAKELLFRYMLAVGKRLRSSLLVANAWHSRADAAASLVAAIGIAGNLAGLVLADALAAAIVGCMIARMGWKFGYAAMADLTDHALDPADVAAIEATLRTTPGVRDVHALRTRKMGDDAIVDAHLRVGPYLTVSEGHRIAEAASNAVKSQHRVLDALIHIDPEDDALSPQAQALPARERILAELEAAAGPLAAQSRALLHYLDGGVEVDLLFPPNIDVSQLQRLAEALTALQQRRDWLRAVRVFAGQPHG